MNELSLARLLSGHGRNDRLVLLFNWCMQLFDQMVHSGTFIPDHLANRYVEVSTVRC
jgi:hypothetical protein